MTDTSTTSRDPLDPDILATQVTFVVEQALWGCSDGGLIDNDDTSVPVGEYRRLLWEGNPVARHWLIVTRDPDPNFDDVDLDVIHEGCPSKVTICTAGEEDVRFLGVGDGDRNTEYTEHLCQVQAEIDEVGLSGALGNSEVDVDQLRPGRYEIEAWNTYYPAVPGLHGPEWDGGIRLVDPPEETEEPVG